MRRRRLIKSAGAVTLVSQPLMTTAVGAGDGNSYTTTEELGLESEVEDLMMSQKIDEAESLLEEEGVEHSFSRTERTQPTSDSSSEMGTADYQKDKMHADIGLVRNSGDIYSLWGNVAAPEQAIGQNRWRQDWVKDAVGFSANSSVWSPDDPTRSNLDIRVSGGDHEVTMDKYHEEDGVACEISLDSWDNPQKLKPIQVSLGTTIEHIGDSKTQDVSIVYRHTSGRTPLGDIKSINIGGLLALTLSTMSKEVWNYPLKATTDLSS